MSVARVVVCDVDGVVRHFDAAQQALIEARYGLAAGVIGALAFDPQLLLPAITGAVPDDIWRASIAVEIRRRWPSIDAAAAVAAWSASPGAADDGVVDLLRRTRARVPVLALTNATTRLQADLARLRLASLFDYVVSSADIGHAKPAAEAYDATHEAATRLLGTATLDPQSVLFVDDDAVNVEAAAAFGWTAIRFTGSSQLAAALRASGVLPT